MRERSDGGGEPNAGDEVRKRRIELSVAQVAGSAVAAVVAAKLASYFGVYGTILGAGVVSVLATCGGSVFQHFLRRTGEQLRGVAASPGPVPGPSPATAPAGRTAPPVGEFTEGTVYRARIKSWKRPVLAAALVFGVTMAGITAYELVSGDSFSGGRGTTVGYAVTGHRTPSVTSDGPAPTSSPTRTPGTGTGTGDGARPGDAASGSPDRGTGVSPAPTPEATGNGGNSGGTGDTGSAGTDGTGAGDPSDAGTTAPAPGASATAPAPSASSRSGTAAEDPAGPATP
ncbi:hypothetical protein ACFY2M_21025 [Streptomyces sp. NPDC001276]|uniref:hypothetical protein n=1 Tax=Streptomyces sp. NPDC001276 TaxID=3364555 RepID=UPI0036AF7FCD